MVEAYEAAWEALFQAGDPPDPDSPRLAEHRTGDNLTSTKNGLAGLRSEGLVLTGSYESGIVELTVDDDVATIEDCGFDRGEIRSATSGEVVDPPDDEPDGLEVELVLEDGAWKIRTLLQAPQVCQDESAGGSGSDPVESEES